MMNFLRGFLDRLLLVSAVIAGGLVPGFIAQYRQRLGGRLDQARLDLEPWQKIANQYHHGNLDALIQYHIKSEDRTFHSEGEALRTLVDAVRHLQVDFDALHANLVHQVQYLLFHADPAMVRSTFGDWVPTFALSVEGVAFAVVFALLVWLLFQGICAFLYWVAGGRKANRPKYKPPEPAVRPPKVRREPILK